MICQHYNYYYRYKLGGGIMLPLICSHNPKKKTRVVVISAGHKHPALPSRKFPSCTTAPRGQATLGVSAGWGEVSRGKKGQGREISCLRQTSELSHTSLASLSLYRTFTIGRGRVQHSQAHGRNEMLITQESDIPKGKHRPSAKG